jgi:hypothetical protein
MMRIAYQSVSPGVLLVTGWLLVAVAMSLRMLRGLDVPLVNGLFVFIGLGAYYLPVPFSEQGRGEALRRKLLWLLVAAGVLVLGAELLRLLVARGRM